MAKETRFKCDRFYAILSIRVLNHTAKEMLNFCIDCKDIQKHGN